MIKQPLKGMNDFIPEEAGLRDYMMGQIIDVYHQFGFERIYTPAIEDIENINNKLTDSIKENKRLKEEIAHYELKDLVSSAKLVNDISIIDKIYNDKDTKYISKLANKITEEDNKIVLFALINGDRVNLVFSCSKNLNSLDMNSLLKYAIKLIDWNGGGNKFNAQGGGKNNSNLESLINYTLMKLQNELD